MDIAVGVPIRSTSSTSLCSSNRNPRKGESGLPRLRHRSRCLGKMRYLCNVMKNYRHYPKTKKQDYSKLFTEEEKAKLEYFENHDFRMFVYSHDEHDSGLSLTELYKIYTEGSMQLSLF